jgi:mannose-1-phosphate guanylyltransferase/mannose-1-phosphate guanylyltransferase/mannose-6-phosphate isomerase
MDETRITPVILCGGSGTRLWPRSRAEVPKPFLPLIGARTLFQGTLERCRDSGFAEPIVVTGAAHVDLVELQSEDVSIGEIIVEPEPKQTAAAVALGALRLPADAVMLVCPSDHHIEDVAAFKTAAFTAAELASDNWLVCLGINAVAPETGFGYLRRGDPLGEKGFKVEQFVEKPSPAVAQDYVASGEFAWNGGIFAFRAGDYLRELEKHRPAAARAVRQAAEAGKSAGTQFHPDPDAFATITAESLDYAVMENTDRAAMVMADMGWSDIGNWQALHRARAKDEAGNSVHGSAELIDCRNLLVESDGPKVHVVGLENLVIVVDGEDVLVASAEGAQGIARLSGPSKR